MALSTAKAPGCPALNYPALHWLLPVAELVTRFVVGLMIGSYERIMKLEGSRIYLGGSCPFLGGGRKHGRRPISQRELLHPAVAWLLPPTLWPNNGSSSIHINLALSLHLSFVWDC